ncbi:MAG: TonB family protein [Acidobacteriota bacterium]|nr:TonB family protein [Acidobacteriota bacterium]
MFDKLVESTSNKQDFARKGSFFLGTMVIYGVLITAAMVASIYFYNANLDAQNLELVTLVAPVPVQAAPEPEAPKQQEAKPQTTQQEVATRTELVARVDQVTKEPPQVSVVASKVPPIPKGVPVRLGTSNTEVARVAGPSGPIGSGSGGLVGGNTGGNIIQDTGDEPPPPPKATPTPPPRPRAPVSGGVLNGKATSKPAPPYPPIAKAARASGTVVVQITVDESGKVVSARAVSGHPLLQQAAVQAAYGARFSPTMLSGQPVKVTGTISYTFNLQ